jgi:hypothetical protein
MKGRQADESKPERWNSANPEKTRRNSDQTRGAKCFKGSNPYMRYAQSVVPQRLFLPGYVLESVKSASENRR